MMIRTERMKWRNGDATAWSCRKGLTKRSCVGACATTAREVVSCDGLRDARHDDVAIVYHRIVLVSIDRDGLEKRLGRWMIVVLE